MILNLSDNCMTIFFIQSQIKLQNLIQISATQIPSPCHPNTTSRQNSCHPNTTSLPPKYHHLATQIPRKSMILPPKYHVSIEIYRILYRVSIECLKKCFFRTHFLNTRFQLKNRTVFLGIFQFKVFFTLPKKRFLQIMSYMFSSHPLPPPKIEAVRPAR